MDVPNVITAGRFFLAAAGAAALLFLPPETGYPVALGIFVLAAISDWLDGALARKLGRLSPLGAFMDPLADKVIIYMYFVYLMNIGMYPVWLLMAFLARDLMHDAYRAYAASSRVSMPANILSKTKTALQMLSLIAALAHLCLMSLQWIDPQNGMLAQAALVGMIAAFLFGVAGAWQTISEYRRFFLQGE